MVHVLQTFGPKQTYNNNIHVGVGYKIITIITQGNIIIRMNRPIWEKKKIFFQLSLQT